MWRRRVCCLESYAVAAFYFGPGELASFHCNTHGDVRVRSDGAADANARSNADQGISHLSGDCRYLLAPTN